MEFDSTRPKWRQIFEVIASRIESGEYPPGHLISAAQLEQDFGVARATVAKVTAALRDERLIRTETGMGSFVTDRGKGAPPR
ncbi:GntR family transcriptional regulator [Kitasatospora sp. NBC_01266]|uniref:GntR family transcriptional regulator n=1 Tax=Kitasatospora sp. NBC_01266 TaxID=2903572 RepID=UPI002E37C01C|nr:GntR family transcriptional regulator [Kitasatospora sp. NBC_01266]